MNPARLVPPLLNWFVANARDLPWRCTDDPYAIWVSEIMLQQTQVKTVVAFWERWMRELPTIHSLAKADPQKIHKLWEGLGYYTRVRNMQKAARLIMARHGGQFPTTFEDVLDLPGIGRYTAGAICSIAFNQPHPILDGNVIRVLTRVFGIEGSPKEKAVNAHLWHLAERLVQSAAGSAEISDLKSQISNPRSKISNFRSQFSDPPSQIANRKSQISNLNESLMELGALICTPRQPSCHVCPISRLCVARKQGRTEELPRRTERPAATGRRFIAFVTHWKAKFLVRQRVAGVVNAHLWEFPNTEVPNEDGDPSKAAILIFGSAPAMLVRVCTIRHSITRYRITLDVYKTAATNRIVREQKDGRWRSRKELARLPFSSAHKKILAVL